MKKFRKRMGALVIVVLMIVSLIPVAALAATPAEVTADPVNATVNVGDKVTFTVTGSSFAWNVDKHDGNGFVTADSSAVTGASGETTGTLTISAAEAGMNGWDFMCTTDGGDSAIKTLTVNTNTTPQINAQPTSSASGAVEEGTEVSFTVTMKANGNIENMLYQWQVKKAGTDAWVNSTDKGCLTTKLVVYPVYADNGNQYRVVATNGDTDESVISDAVALEVKVPDAGPEVPVVTVAVDPNTVKIGEAATLTADVKVKEGSELAYQWYFMKAGEKNSFAAPVKIAGATSKTYEISAATADDAGKYYCDVTNKTYENQVGTSEAGAVKLTVNEPDGTVTITADPVAATVFAGGNATFTVAAKADNGAALTYQWQQKRAGYANWTDLEGQTDASLTISNAALAMNGYSYQCVVTNEADGKDATSAAAVLTVKVKSSAPVIGKDIPKDVQVFVGEKKTLEVVASAENGDPLTYQWFVKIPGGSSAVEMAGETKSSYTIPAVTLADKGKEYQCKITNPKTDETVSSETAVLDVWVADAVPQITAQPQDADVEAGTDVDFVTAVKPVDGKTFDYKWEISKDGGKNWTAVTASSGATDAISGVTDAKLTITKATAASDGLYRCEIKVNGNSGKEAAYTNPASLKVWTANTPYLVKGLEATTAAFEGRTATLSVEAKVNPNAALSYEWSVSTDNGSTFKPIAGATGASYTTDVLTAADNDKQIKCTVWNNAYNTSIDTKTTLSVTQSTDIPSFDDSTELDIDRVTGFVSGITAGKTAAAAPKASDVAAMFNVPAGYSVAVIGADGKELSGNDTVGTGCMVKLLAVDGSEADSLTVIVAGDVEGKGFVSISSLVAQSFHMTGSKPLSGPYMAAGDMNGDGNITISDIVAASKLML